MYTDKLITFRKYFKMAAKSGLPFLLLTTLYPIHFSYTLFITDLHTLRHCTDLFITRGARHSELVTTIADEITIPKQPRKITSSTGLVSVSTELYAAGLLQQFIVGCHRPFIYMKTAPVDGL